MTWFEEIWRKCGILCLMACFHLFPAEQMAATRAYKNNLVDFSQMHHVYRLWAADPSEGCGFNDLSRSLHSRLGPAELMLPLKKTQPMKPQSWKANVTQVIVSGHWICPQASFALQYRLLRTKILEGQKDCGKPLHCIPSLGSLESENVLTHRFVQGFLCQWR